MKILEIIENDQTFTYRIDNEGRPDFVYEKDRFQYLSDVEAEINKSINQESLRKGRIKQKIDNIKANTDMFKPKEVIEDA
jgi:hypothetical protein